MAVQAFTRAPFKLGMKEVFLPEFTITLIRQTTLPPTFATFLVPLNLNKLDMRDYLYHAYNVKTISIRSFIKLSPVRAGNPNSTVPSKKLMRPKPTKKMTVEMDKPFVFPEVPEDFEPWSRDRFLTAEKEQRQVSESRMQNERYVDKSERRSMKEQAETLLEGRERWREEVD